MLDDDVDFQFLLEHESNDWMSFTYSRSIKNESYIRKIWQRNKNQLSIIDAFSKTKKTNVFWIPPKKKWISFLPTQMKQKEKHLSIIFVMKSILLSESQMKRTNLKIVNSFGKNESLWKNASALENLIFFREKSIFDFTGWNTFATRKDLLTISGYRHSSVRLTIFGYFGMMMRAG